MHNKMFENKIKTYKAYQGNRINEWIMFAPWLLLELLGLGVDIRALITGDRNDILLFFSLTVGLLVLIPAVLVTGIVMWTSLSLYSDGIEHQRVELQQTTSLLMPFKPAMRKMRVRWDEIYEVGWLPKEPVPPVGFTPKLTTKTWGQGNWITQINHSMIIKTKAGDIVFCVMCHPRINAEIMEEILARAPQLNKPVVI